MSRHAIHVEQLSKCFRIGAPKAKAETLIANAMQDGAAAVGRLLGRTAEPATSEHWALRDINLTVGEGEVVSVIGHNGSGKSTLLKILSRISVPSRGRAVVRGRMASLLEVGTGFHPDLSGRDNVFLNAAILGMRREDIRRRFDAIVDFAGVEAFIDTPVKHYSSGMKVRLGFAVAAHLDPDVLVIDEVLAVGDAAFQQRCLNRIEEVGAAGHSILYVSHHLPSVARLSKRTVVLDHGQILFDGPTLTAIRRYEERIGGFHSRRSWEPGQAPGDDRARLLSLQLSSGGKPVAGPVDTRQPVELTVRYEVLRAGVIQPSLHLFDFTGTPVLSSIDTQPGWHGVPRAPGVYEARAIFPGNWFNEGSFQLAVSLFTVEPFHCHAYEHQALAFSFYDAAATDGARGLYRGDLKGYLRPQLDWQNERLGA